MSSDSRPSLHAYINEPHLIPETELDHLDEPGSPHVKPLVETEPRSEQRFFTRLTERLEQLMSDTPPAGLERLVEIEHSMLGTMEVLIERVARYATQYANTQDDMKNVLETHRAMLHQITESQAEINAVQTRLVESQEHIADAIRMLAKAISEKQVQS